MGYSYSMSGTLCCDGCPASTGVRKRKCPHGYCQSPAMCSSCYATKKGKLAEYHAKQCAPAAAKYAAREAHKKALLEAGAALRCSAYGTGKDLVHVLFSKLDGSTVGYYMTAETYDAATPLEPMTPEDYAKLGKIEPAPSTFSYGRTTKQTA